MLLLREVWSPMSDAQLATVLGTLGALTKGASWTYRAQQVGPLSCNWCSRGVHIGAAVHDG